MCAPCVTPCCVRCCILGAMTTQLGLQAQVTLFTQKLPKGGKPPMWWTRLSLWQTDERVTCESQVIKTEVSILLIPSTSVRPDRVCLSFPCLLFDTGYPGLPYFATWCFLVKSLWVHIYSSLAVFLFSPLYIHRSVQAPMSDSASQQPSRQWPGPAISPPHRQFEAWHLLEGPVVSEQI